MHRGATPLPLPKKSALRQPRAPTATCRLYGQSGDLVPMRRGKSADKISIAKHNLARPSDRRFAARRFGRFAIGV